MKFVISLTDGIKRFLSSPTEELSRWQRTARFYFELCVHCAKELRHDRAGQMAAALTYRTIFSMIPVVVLSLVVFSAFEGFGDLRDQAQSGVLEYLGFDALHYEQGTGEDRGQNLVIGKINEITDKVQSLNFTSIGGISFALLAWAAIGLVISMEHSFNQIYGGAPGRSLARRVTLYWSALTLGPVLILVSVFMTTQVVGYVEPIPWVGPLLKQLSRFTALGATWFLLVFLYSLMPNTKVRLRSAMLGGIVAAVLWELAKYGFGLYVRKAVPYAEIYGVLGLIPLFLFWVYITWLIILFGLELTFTHQAMGVRRFKHDAERKEQEVWLSPSWLLPVAARIAKSFEAGQPCEAQAISKETGLPERAVVKMLAALEQGGVIHQVASGELHEGVSLSKPASSIPATAIFDAAHKLLPDRAKHADREKAWRVVEQLRVNDRQQLEGKTLADLCG